MLIDLSLVVRPRITRADLDCHEIVVRNEETSTLPATVSIMLALQVSTEPCR